MSASPEHFSVDLDFPETQLSAAIGKGLARLAKAISWIWLLLVFVIVVNVVMRYAFGEGRIEFEEIQWHLYSIGFLVGIATCVTIDQHIRVDAFSARLSLPMRAWIELYGLLLLYFPFVTMVLIFSIPFVEYSFSIGEVSGDPGGLGGRWMIKSALPLGMILLLVAGFARLLRVSSYLFGTPRAVLEKDEADVH